MRLADHGVAADAAQLVSNLAGSGAIGPHLFQGLDPFVRPGHAILSETQVPRKAGGGMPQPIGGRPGNAQLAKAQPDCGPLPPGKPVLTGINWVGLKTLYIKEVRRFFKVQMQTVWAPAITTLLYLAIFTVALGRGGRTVMGVVLRRFRRPRPDRHGDDPERVRQLQLLAAGRQDQGKIVDYLMPPIWTGELIAGLVGATVTRAFLVGSRCGWRCCSGLACRSRSSIRCPPSGSG